MNALDSIHLGLVHFAGSNQCFYCYNLPASCFKSSSCLCTRCCLLPSCYFFFESSPSFNRISSGN